MKIESTFIFRLHRRPIQLVMLVPVVLSLKQPGLLTVEPTELC